MSDTPSEDAVADPIAFRQNEVAQYDATISMYRAIASSLPSEWPEHLSHFKGRTDTHAAIAEINDLDDVQLVADLWAHDQAQAAVRSNMVERTKAQAILTVLLAQQ